MTSTFVIGTRGSKLAVAQARLVASALERAHPGLRCELRTIVTEGDRRLDRSLVELGGKGIFVAELEQALLSEEIDAAVHSLKDLPTEQPPGLELAAILERADARDVLVTREGAPLATLEARARVGSSSARRSMQLAVLRPDLRIDSVRGNVDTRLRKLDSGEYDGLLLAAAGLDRLGLAGRIAEYFEPEQLVPAAGQGALAVQVRSGNAQAMRMAAALDHVETRQAVEAERALLECLGGGCHLPIGAFARIDGQEMALLGAYGGPDGLKRGCVSGLVSRAGSLANTLAEMLRVCHD